MCQLLVKDVLDRLANFIRAGAVRDLDERDTGAPESSALDLIAQLCIAVDIMAATLVFEDRNWDALPSRQQDVASTAGNRLMRIPSPPFSSWAGFNDLA